MKDIVIIADFCGPLDGTFNSRFLYLADMLSKDNEVEIITSNFNHSSKKHFQYEIEKHDYRITMLHEATYSKNICLKRFYAHYVWGKNVRKYLRSRKKPDAVFCAIPPLTGAYEAAKYCEKNNIRLIIDIQDLWPEAFKLVFNVPIISDIMFFPFKILADGIYKRADSICAVSRTYADRALNTNKKCNSSHVVFLGTRLETFDENAKKNKVEKPQNELWIGYCGTLGASYDITIVIDALALLKEKGVKPPKFIVLGDGEKQQELEDRARKLGVDCVFTGRLPYDEMCGWLNACDIAVNPIMHNAAQSIINKHGDYASAGIPVLSTQENQEYRNLVDVYNMGFNCENGNVNDLGDKIQILIEDENLRTEMGKNARRCAEEKFDRNETYNNLINAILDKLTNIDDGVFL